MQRSLDLLVGENEDDDIMFWASNEEEEENDLDERGERKRRTVEFFSDWEKGEPEDVGGGSGLLRNFTKLTAMGERRGRIMRDKKIPYSSTLVTFFQN